MSEKTAKKAVRKKSIKRKVVSKNPKRAVRRKKKTKNRRDRDVSLYNRWPSWFDNRHLREVQRLEEKVGGTDRLQYYIDTLESFR